WWSELFYLHLLHFWRWNHHRRWGLLLLCHLAQIRVRYIQRLLLHVWRHTGQKIADKKQHENERSTYKSFDQPPVVGLAQIICAIILITTLENDIEDVGIQNVFYLHVVKFIIRCTTERISQLICNYYVQPKNEGMSKV